MHTMQAAHRSRSACNTSAQHVHMHPAYPVRIHAFTDSAQVCRKRVAIVVFQVLDAALRPLPLSVAQLWASPRDLNELKGCRYGKHTSFSFDSWCGRLNASACIRAFSIGWFRLSSGDDRTLDKLVDGVAVTTDDRHMWLIALGASKKPELTIDLVCAQWRKQPRIARGCCIGSGAVWMAKWCVCMRRARTVRLVG